MGKKESLYRDLGISEPGVVLFIDGAMTTSNILLTDTSHFTNGEFRLVPYDRMQRSVEKDGVVCMVFENPFNQIKNLSLTLDIKINCGVYHRPVCNAVWASGDQNGKKEIENIEISGNEIEKMAKVIKNSMLNSLAGININQGMSVLHCQKTIKVDGDHIYVGFYSNIPWYVKTAKESLWGGVQIDIIKAELKEPITEMLS